MLTNIASCQFFVLPWAAAPPRKVFHLKSKPKRGSRVVVRQYFLPPSFIVTLNEGSGTYKTKKERKKKEQKKTEQAARVVMSTASLPSDSSSLVAVDELLTREQSMTCSSTAGGGNPSDVESTPLSVQPSADNRRFTIGTFRASYCPICFESFTEDNPAVLLPCQHAYHLQCHESWRQRSKLCAVCQLPVVDELVRLMTSEDIVAFHRQRTQRANVPPVEPEGASSPLTTGRQPAAATASQQAANSHDEQAAAFETVEKHNARSSEQSLDPGSDSDESRDNMPHVPQSQAKVLLACLGSWCIHMLCCCSLGDDSSERRPARHHHRTVAPSTCSRSALTPKLWRAEEYNRQLDTSRRAETEQLRRVQRDREDVQQLREIRDAYIRELVERHLAQGRQLMREEHSK